MKKDLFEQITSFMNDETREASIDVEALEVERKKYFLLKGLRENVEKKNLKNFKPGDAIWGECAEPIVLKEFSNLGEALEELSGYKCSIDEHIELCDIVEYAIEIQKVDEDGDVVSSDYELAEN